MQEETLERFLEYLYEEIESNENKLKELDCVPPGLPVTDSLREQCQQIRSELKILRQQAKKTLKELS